MATKEDYERAFEAERHKTYPAVAEFEARMGFAVSRLRLEGAAFVLACPVKVNPPNWQHGRVIYSMLRHYLAQHPYQHHTILDIGTAKGFSALCMVWALIGAGARGSVHSVDVLNPKMRVRRNTVAEVDGLKTLAEILEPFPESANASFEHAMGVDWLALHDDRVHFAFVDGKHDFRHVAREAELLRDRQQPGDVIIFDDLQIPGVADAVAATVLSHYATEILIANDKRRYCIAVKL